MKSKIKSFIFLIFFTLLFLSRSFGEGTPNDGLFVYTLSNGLKVFVAENHTVPLTYIEIAVKCGAFTQEAETAGLFHLYEHMMFKGNSLFSDAAAITRALSNMGVSNWNGTTGVDCVNYYFTIPSDLTREGLEFWNAAIRTPKLDEKELENEKKVVLSEISANLSDPDYKIQTARSKILFPAAPYKLSPGGDPLVVQNATTKALKLIQKNYYTADNAALFVGGDVDPAAIEKMAKEIFGSWEGSENTIKKPFLHTKTPLEKPIFQVAPYDQITDEIFKVSVAFRAPDSECDTSDTYPADVITMSLSDPSTPFVNAFLMDESLGLLGRDYFWANYPTRRTTGVFSFGAILKTAGDPVTKKTFNFLSTLNTSLSSLHKLISESDIKKVVNQILDTNALEAETAKGLLTTLRFWWIATSEDYFFTYKDNIEKVTDASLKSFCEKYFIGKSPLVTVLLSPSVYKKEKSAFKKAGYQVIN